MKLKVKLALKNPYTSSFICSLCGRKMERGKDDSGLFLDLDDLGTGRVEEVVLCEKCDGKSLLGFPSFRKKHTIRKCMEIDEDYELRREEYFERMKKAKLCLEVLRERSPYSKVECSLCGREIHHEDEIVGILIEDRRNVLFEIIIGEEHSNEDTLYEGVIDFDKETPKTYHFAKLSYA